MKRMEYNGNKNIVCERIRQAREKAKLSQDELAAKMQALGVNMDQQIISRIERNLRIVTDYEVVCFAKALKVDEDWLLKDGISAIE